MNEILFTALINDDMVLNMLLHFKGYLSRDENSLMNVNPFFNLPNHFSQLHIAFENSNYLNSECELWLLFVNNRGG